jgi:serine/threonine protein kinase
MSSLQRIGNYRLGKTLGVGSFGKVKLAEHEQTVSCNIFLLLFILGMRTVRTAIPARHSGDICCATAAECL